MSIINELDKWSAVIDRHDIYQGPGVGMYDTMSQSYDLSTPVMMAAELPGPVLELCCGAGRVGLPLLAMGVDYTGIDLSPAMLDQFAGHARDQGLDVTGRLIAGDAADLSELARAWFVRVMVPAFSLVLFEQSVREALFRSVRETLAPGGVFTAEIYTDTYYQDVFRGQQSICDWSPRDHGGYVVSFAEIRENREEIRFLEQRLDGPPILLHTWKWVYTSDQLVAELVAAGFEITERRPSVCPLAEWVTARPV
jgi:SAM-dependent methyltransferase